MRICGYGGPVHPRRAMFHADTEGTGEVVAALDKQQAKLGDGFAIAPLLQQMAAVHTRFTD